MPKKRFSSEQIIAKLRQIEVQLAHGKSIALTCKNAAISEQSSFRWRKEYGGLQIEQARRLKDLERENARLRRPFTCAVMLWRARLPTSWLSISPIRLRLRSASAFSRSVTTA